MRRSGCSIARARRRPRGCAGLAWNSTGDERCGLPSWWSGCCARHPSAADWVGRPRSRCWSALGSRAAGWMTRVRRSRRCEKSGSSRGRRRRARALTWPRDCSWRPSASTSGRACCSRTPWTASRRSHGRYDAACARLELATSLGALGRSDDAVAEAAMAEASLRDLGAAREAARARLLADAAEGGGDPQLAAVTRREREVLCLLATGLTNREIAEQLVISEHTVHRHVTNLLSKLGLTSRTAAAAHAVRCGLMDPSADSRLGLLRRRPQMASPGEDDAPPRP